jgi:hypothetical protein
MMYSVLVFLRQVIDEAAIQVGDRLERAIRAGEHDWQVRIPVTLSLPLCSLLP